jgi:CheY-like chemotaxis protein
MTGKASRPPTLLLADDSITIQRVLELTFADEDIRVVVVGNGQQAIDRLSSEPPDIVLADISMSEVSGYEVAAFVKTQPALADIPVLLLTGAFEAFDEARVQACGADGVLVKPFEPSLVIGRVRDLLGRRTARTSADSASGRVITSSEPPAPAPPARSGDAPASVGGQARELSSPWEEPLASTGPGRDAEPAGGRPDDELNHFDEAFDHLDARLSNPNGPARGPSPARAGQAADGAAAPVFEIEDEWFGAEVAEAAREQAGLAVPYSPAPPQGPSAELPAGTDVPPSVTGATFAGPPPSVADAFAAFLAQEQGETFTPAAGPLVVTETLVEEVAARVAAKLTHDRLNVEMRAVLVETAERRR